MEDAEPTEEDSVAHFVSQLPDHVSMTPFRSLYQALRPRVRLLVIGTTEEVSLTW